LGDATDAIHLKDSKEQPDGEWYHVPVGSGDGQVLRILEDLAKRDWAGMLSIEPHLTHSRAVLATGPGGQQNQQFASMSPADTFQVAAEAGIDLLKRVGKR
jgi:L-ribulose-5-phosphate 3-epimerase UlaE